MQPFSTFDPDGKVDEARVERAAFAAFKVFIRDPQRAAERWQRMPDRSRERWLAEQRAALEAAA